MAAIPPANTSGAPENLRCEYLVNPLGVGTRHPRLSWEVRDSRRGAKQRAYQILVAGSQSLLNRNQGDVWDSGKVVSEQSIQIPYRGMSLEPSRQYFWKVRTWDTNDTPSPWSKPAKWAMGLLKPEDWKAKWVSDNENWQPFHPAHNGYHSEFAPTPDSPKWVQVDLGSSKVIDAVKLFPARPFDWHEDMPGFLFPRRFRLDVSNESDFRQPHTVIDHTIEDMPNPLNEVQTYRFEPVPARYVRLTAIKLRARDGNNFGLALAEMQVLAGDDVVSQGASASAPDSIESHHWSTRNLTDGDLTSHPAVGIDALHATMIRKEFLFSRKVKRALLFVTALGLYEVRLNGRRVGNQVLAPEWTDYHRRVQYQTYDVSSQVQAGRNTIGVILGDGWYAGRIGMAAMLTGTGQPRAVYGRRPELLLQLRLEFDDGTTQFICTDETWRYTVQGTMRSADLLDGEQVDARMEIPGWDKTGFDEGGWRHVRLSEGTKGAIVSQPNEPIQIVKELKPIALTEPEPGVYLYDLGQNMVGWGRLKLRGLASGTNLILRYGEALNPDGTLYTANLRGAPQTDRYTARGGREMFEPRFTYHGFRYVEIRGLPSKPKLNDLTGCVIASGAAQTGRFECSHPMLNRLWQNILWTQRGNMHSVPTDCPQRDERLGWMGDIQVFSQTAIFNLDMTAFFTKWVQDIRDAQAEDGRYPDFAPLPTKGIDHFRSAPAWGDAGTIVPWRVYVNYGDQRMLEEHYESARRWVDYIHRLNPDLIWNNGRGNDYNDWLNADTWRVEGIPTTGGSVPNRVLATAFFAHSTEIVAKMAAALGRDEEARRYRERFEAIKAAFNRIFVLQDGHIEGDTQAGYALALNFDLLPESIRPLAAEHMVNGLTRYNGNLSTGIQTTHRLMLELSRYGYHPHACRLITSREFPSWGYMIEQGATTIWERWDGYVAGRGFQDPGMNSLNHYALGAVGEWLYRVLLGLNPDEDAPGWKHFSVRPQPGGGITWAKGEYHSIHGLIQVTWKLEKERFALDLTVPPNTTATVFLPAVNMAGVFESGKPLSGADGVKFLRTEAGAVVIKVDAGRYRFGVRRG